LELFVQLISLGESLVLPALGLVYKDAVPEPWVFLGNPTKSYHVAPLGNLVSKAAE
jgi:hypothetical protein